MEAFGYHFESLNKGIGDELQSLEYDGSTTARFWSEEDEEFQSYRIEFEPAEIVQGFESEIAGQDGTPAATTQVEPAAGD